MRGSGQDWLEKMIQNEGAHAVGRHFEIVALFGADGQRSSWPGSIARALTSLFLLPAGGVIKPAL